MLPPNRPSLLSRIASASCHSSSSAVWKAGIELDACCCPVTGIPSDTAFNGAASDDMSVDLTAPNRLFCCSGIYLVVLAKLLVLESKTWMNSSDFPGPYYSDFVATAVALALLLLLLPLLLLLAVALVASSHCRKEGIQVVHSLLVLY